MDVQDISFSSAKGERLAGRIYTGAKSTEGIIFCHGLFSSKDGQKIVRMAPVLTNAGYSVLAFDFSFVPEIEQGQTRLNIIQEVDDLRAAVDYFSSKVSTIHLVGSSMGGVIAALYASEHPDRVRTLSMIASPVDLRDLIERISEGADIYNLPDDGMTVISGIFIANRFFKDALAIPYPEILRRIATPTLVVIGDRDELISIDAVRRFYQDAKDTVKLVVIPGGNHSLYKEEEIRRLGEEITAWIRSHP